MLEEKILGFLKENLYKQLTKIGHELVAASNMGGLNAKDKKKYKSSLENILKELSTNAIDDPSILELLDNNQKLLNVIPDKKIFPGKTQKIHVQLFSLKPQSLCLCFLILKTSLSQK